MNTPPTSPPTIDPLAPGSQPVLVQLSNIAPTPVRWLWPQRIPLGKLTLLVGDPAVGKSLLCLDLAARVSAGIPWPDSPESSNQPGGVVLLSAEEDLADTIRPRLDAAGADHSRIVAVTSVKQNLLSPLPSPTRTARLMLGLAHLEIAIQNTPDCRLVIIDPLTTSIGQAPSETNTRAVLEPLPELAARHHVAIVAVYRAPRTATGFSLHRMVARLSPAVARTVWALVADPDDPKRRLLVPVKNTLADHTSLLPCYITSQKQQAPCLRWTDEPVAISPEAALDQSAAGEGHIAARDWLRQKLAKGPDKAISVLDDAKYDGFSQHTIRRAFRQIKAQRVRSGFGPKAFWVWSLPSHKKDNEKPE